jgi:drug/metabolite transporter (DMT)-like permease
LASTPSVSTSFLAAKAHPIRGYLYIAGATFLWGIAATLGRAVFTGRLLPSGKVLPPIDPLILSQARTSFSLLVLLPILVARRGWKNLKMPAADLGGCFLLGVLGVAVSNYLYYFAIQKTNVAVAIILQYTAPAWVLLHMVWRGLQKATWKRVWAVALAVMGCALAVGVVGAGGFHLNAAGVIASLVASFSFAFYNIAGHGILARYDRWQVLLWTLTAASTFWLAVNPPWKIAAAHFSASQWLFLLTFSLISVLAPFALYFAGLQHLEPTRAIVASCLEPVFSILIAAVVLGEFVKPVQVLGIVIVLTAIILIQRPERGAGEALAMVEPIE